MPKGSNTTSKHELKQRVTTRSIRPGDLEHQATLTRTKTRESTTPYTEERLGVEAELAAERTKSIAIAPTKTSDGTILVDWYTTEDPANSQNWSSKNLNWKAVYYSSLLASESIGHIMCQFKYTHHSYAHTLPKLEEPSDPSCKLCVSVLVALKYYHDQPTQTPSDSSCRLCVPGLVALKYYHDQPMQVCIENSFQQRPVRMPKLCRPMGSESLRDAEDTAHTHAQDLTRFEGIME